MTPLYINYDYVNRPDGIFSELITDSHSKGFDTTFTGLVDYGHYWCLNKNMDYEQTDPSLKPRSDREPIYKALYGIGCLTASWLIRTGKMVGGKIGILKLSNPDFALRINVK